MISPKQFFLHLFSTAALFAAVISLLTVIFQSVNVWLPDTLSYFGGVNESMRLALAALLVFAPSYLWATNKLTKDPAGQVSWLSHLTMFVAGITFLVDLMIVFYNFFGGELTTRFGIKSLAVLLVAAGIFYFYRGWIKGFADSKSTKVFTWIFAVLSLVVLVMGFFAGGAPWTVRTRELDVRRTQDLMAVQNYVLSFWQKENKLPENLPVDFVPKDPETGLAYEYKLLFNLKFEVCAEFKLPAQDNNYRDYYSYPNPTEKDWYTFPHEAGRVCFEREIDPRIHGLPKPIN
jgi:hypothetical protein